MKYIIMADGMGMRWKNHNRIPKHLVKVNGVTLLERTTALIKTYSPDSEVIITTHNENYETPGAVLYAPLHNELEIDRFTAELIDDDICFIYGDTYYSDYAIEQIVKAPVEDILFFGADKSIVGIKIKNGALFRHHVERVRKLFLNGEIQQCIGWQVYLSFCGLPLDKKQIAQNFVLFEDLTKNFNTPDDLEQFAQSMENANKNAGDSKRGEI